MRTNSPISILHCDDGGLIDEGYVLSVNVGEDCPVFDGLFEYCSISAGGSMGSSSLSFLPVLSGLCMRMNVFRGSGATVTR